MHNYDYEFLRNQHLPEFPGFDIAPDDLSDLPDWFHAQKKKLDSFADDIAKIFVESHRCAAEELQMKYPFQYELGLVNSRQGISHVWNRLIFFGGRMNPKRIEYNEISCNAFGKIPEWERDMYQRFIVSLNLLYKHQKALRSSISKHRGLRVSLTRL